ncbi:MAG: FGGY family carbohydrate kinase [Nitrospirota bacterium]
MVPDAPSSRKAARPAAERRGAAPDATSMTRSRPLILALDQGSGSTRALVFDSTGRVVAEARRPLATRTPKPGWVEHDPDELLRGATAAMSAAAQSVPRSLRAIGLTAQRSTIVLWDRRTGRPVSPAVSWQDRRAVDVCRAMASAGPFIRRVTGLRLSPYYAGPKIRWLLDHLPTGQRRAEDGDLMCGTVNTFLLWHWSGRSLFLTDHTQAGRTLLMNLSSLQWDQRLCDLFGIPRVLLPEIRPTLAEFGEVRAGRALVPVLASIGDQQAAAIGQGGVRRGDLCLNYGTGAFALLFTGEHLVRCRGLLANVAWSSSTQRTYLLEGGVNAVGSGLAWLTKMLRLPKDLGAIERLARSATMAPRVLPALAGLAAPYWDADAESLVSGVSLVTDQADLVYGFLDGVAFLLAQIVRAAPATVPYRRVVAGGGLSAVDLLLELQASYLNRPIHRARFRETSGWGAAVLAGVGAGIWTSPSEAVQLSTHQKIVASSRQRQWIKTRQAGWELVVAAARSVGRSDRG